MPNRRPRRPPPAPPSPARPAPPRAEKPAAPRGGDGKPPAPGDWLWTCREGFEQDLVDELAQRSRALAPRVVAPGVVASRGPAPTRDGTIDLAFARQGFEVAAVARAAKSALLDAEVAAALRARAARWPPDAPWALHVWVPDTTAANPLSRVAETLQRAVELRAPMVDAAWGDRRVATPEAARARGGVLAQVCLLEPTMAVVGDVPCALAPSLHPGGRARMRVSEQAPSRAAMKLEEALDWLGHGPARGESCVDLGAAPGGWTFVVMERGARVTAIDPGAMAPDLMRRRGLTHIRGSAFDFEPEEPVDWLLCDMVWRPLEVAALLAKWQRRRWTRFVVANIKLPMRAKAEFLERVRGILEDGGWRGVRFRHLYHDREEVTLTAHGGT